MEVRTAASGVRRRARAISGYGNDASHATRQRGSKVLGLSTFKFPISTPKFLTCVIFGLCITRNAKDVQIQSLPVVLLGRKAPLIIERNTAPRHPNRTTFFGYICAIYFILPMYEV